MKTNLSTMSAVFAITKQRIRILFIASLTGLIGIGAGPARAAAPDRVLTTAAEVRALSAADAEKHYPVKLRGVVTFYDDALFSRFLQDDTAGIYLQVTNPLALKPGQVVELEGVTGAGEFAPVVSPHSVKVVGEGKLPLAKPATVEELLGGALDSQMVEISGNVRAARYENQEGDFFVDVVADGERFTVVSQRLPVNRPADLLGATVRVRGVCSTLFNRQRQLFGFRLLVPDADSLTVVTPAPANPFDVPARPIDSLLQFTPQGILEHRVKVAGTVVYFEPGSAVFIQNGELGLRCQTAQRESLAPGDQVEVLGSPAKGEYTPILEDAVYRKIGPGTEPRPDEVDLNEILTGTHDCRLVELKATVLNRVDRGVNQFLLLEAGDFIFQADLPQSSGGNRLADLVNGSEVLVRGICLIERGNTWQAGENWRAKSFRLLLRSPKDVQVLQVPSEWSYPTLLCVIGAIEIVILVVILRFVTVWRKTNS